MKESIGFFVTYKTRGYISGAKCEEYSQILLEFMKTTEDKNYYFTGLVKDLKKAFKLFSKENLYDVEVLIVSDYSDRQYLIVQKFEDREAGIYTLYDYTTKECNAKVTKVSKEVAIKTVIGKYTEIVESI